MIIFLYLACISAANVLTASFAPMSFLGILVPVGTFFIGINFLLRDFLQIRHGKRKTYLIIVSALLISAVISMILGDTLTIVYASAFSFLISELADTEIFTAMKQKHVSRFIVSGIVAGVLDSAIFAFVGLLPAGFITLSAVPSVVVGQIIVKSLMQLPVLVLLKTNRLKSA